MTPRRDNSSSSSATLADLMDGLRLRLLLALWAGVLVLVLCALHDLPTKTMPQQVQPQQHRNSLRGPLHHDDAKTAPSIVATTSSTARRVTRMAWRPFLEEEVRAIDMLSQPFQYVFWSNKDSDSNEKSKRRED